ncbi:dihydrofolate reductase family protein [Streptomyces marincola]|uniref:Deaminase n=1 Tax=Streptomyces marincola TaxID=2878388 RepID=A0A1W7CXV5_9ACTN|nr:dihydrofolate reductase family protein [Streptomyces marincola]ARQ69638.1 deaminase [Streptomyces marincola]
MRKLVYYIAVTLDGRIAGPGGEYDFFPLGDEEQAAGYAERMNARYPEFLPTAGREMFGLAGVPNRRCDTVVMGRGTYLPALDAGVTSPYAHLRQYVVSRTLDAGTDPDVTVVPSDPLGLVRRLKQEDGGLDIWLCGGGRLAGELLPEIDELIIKSYPVVAGAGPSVFDGAFDPTLFTPTARETFDNGVLVTWCTAR